MLISFSDKPFTICVCLYGDYPALAKRCLGSIFAFCPRDLFYLKVACNQISDATFDYISSVRNEIDDIYICKHNINKNPMYRRMMLDIDTEYHIWLDDDSSIQQEDTLAYYLDLAKKDSGSTALWGQLVTVYTLQQHVVQYDIVGDHNEMADKVKQFIMRQSWYNGGKIPSGKLRAGDMGEDHDTFELIHGSAYMARTSVLKDILKWPHKGMIKIMDDVILSEAVRQVGYELKNTDGYGFYLNACGRRGEGEDYGTFRHVFDNTEA